MSSLKALLFVVLLALAANVNDGAVTSRRAAISIYDEVSRITTGRGEFGDKEQTPYCLCVCGLPDEWDWSDDVPVIKVMPDTERPTKPDTERPTRPTTSEPTTMPTTTAAPLCPLDTADETIRVRHETDCSSYYECTNGRRVLRHCRPEDRFNVDLEVCDLKENVDCTNRAHYP